jgi:hypothetical protein
VAVLATLIDACKALEEQLQCEGNATLTLEKEKEAAQTLERPSTREIDDTISSPDNDTSFRDATVVSHLQT